MIRFEIQYEGNRLGEIESTESYQLLNQLLDEIVDEEAVRKFTLIPIPVEDPTAKE